MTSTTNKTTHTPGPWKAQRRSGSDYGMEIVADRGRRIVCETICSEHQANADLIATSPDTLASLENLVKAAKQRVLNPSGEGIVDAFVLALGAAETVIAKARGAQ